jgi:hypothetical protein
MTKDEEIAELRRLLEKAVTERNQLAECVLKINEKRFLSHRFTQTLILELEGVRASLIERYSDDVIDLLTPISKPKYRKPKKSKKVPTESKACLDLAKEIVDPNA